MARPKKSEEFPEVKPTFSHQAEQLDVQPKMIVPQEPVRTNPLIHKPISRTPKNTDSIEAMTPATDHMVTGTFVNIECPGQTAKVCGKYYKRMEYFVKVFEDNEKCTIPLSVARYINERICYYQHKHILDANGNPMKSGHPVFRYKFLIEEHHRNHAYAEAA
jgi:hypothetical protein